MLEEMDRPEQDVLKRTYDIYFPATVYFYILRTTGKANKQLCTLVAYFLGTISINTDNQTKN
jgi:hypothetical protein